ncbi:imidazole glycerol phosphate synthase subunit HisF [candidate division KSB1 bacterium]|nr:imidazole glycerol phosphate synthase subunit HisF [candidate division KSB1 bacterium]
MLAKRIIPCLDVKDGRVVKGVHFVNLIDAGDPVAHANFYDAEGADELVFLDITASSDARAILLDMVARVAASIHIPFTVGGGIRTVEDMREILRAGADKISINTAALLQPELIDRAAEVFGSQCIVVAIDARWNGASWDVFTHGGRNNTGRDALQWAKEAQRRGAGELLVTSMDKDGTRSGFDLPLLQALSEIITTPIIASGGAGAIEHFIEAVKLGNADAVLAASLFHFRELRLSDLKQAFRENDIPTRYES